MAVTVRNDSYSVFNTFFLIFCVLLTFSVCSEEESLYNDDKAIVLLNYANFEETISNKHHNWFVEFYARWCGHCIRFAPTWEELAQNTSGKSSFVQHCQSLTMTDNGLDQE